MRFVIEGEPKEMAAFAMEFQKQPQKKDEPVKSSKTDEDDEWDDQLKSDPLAAMLYGHFTAKEVKDFLYHGKTLYIQGGPKDQSQ